MVLMVSNDSVLFDRHVLLCFNIRLVCCLSCGCAGLHTFDTDIEIFDMCSTQG